MDRIWITGFSQFELGIFNQKDPRVEVIKFTLKKYLQQALENTDDLLWLLTGGQSGVEQWAIETALELKDAFPNLQIALMTPYQHFGANWKTDRKAHLTELMRQVDFTDAVSSTDYQNPRQLQNYQRFMLNHTEKALLLYDDMADQSQVRFAKQALTQYQRTHPNYELRQIDFDHLQDLADEYAQEHYEDKFL